MLLFTYSVLQTIEHNAWLWFWALINSFSWNVVAFRSIFYFCIFIYINLFTLVSCALFFFTPFKHHHSSPGSCPHLFLFFPCLTLSGLVSSITGNITVGSFLFPQTIVTTPLLVSWVHGITVLNSSYNFTASYYCFYCPAPCLWQCMLSALIFHISVYTTEKLQSAYGM